MRISVLDQSPIPEGSTGADALRNTLDLARLADELGYHRYWVAEHHGSPMLAGTSPEALIGPIAQSTQRIRVGSGGVMLPHYSPLKVAETFTILAALYPGRIDLGLGRAAGTDQLTMFALQRDRRQAGPDDFPAQLSELLAYFGDTLGEEHPFRRLAQTLPGRPCLPEPWLLGSSAQSAVWAAQLALPYAVADFINPSGAELAALYRRRWAEHQDQPAPRIAVAAWVVCADTDQQAQQLATSSRMTLTAAPWRADPGPAAREGDRVPAHSPPEHRPAAAPARDRRRARDRAWRAGGARRRVRRRGGDRRHDHLRPRGPAPIV